MNDNRQERLFLALPLDLNPADQRAFRHLCQLANELPGDGRPVPEANIHLTLAFLGMVSQLQKEDLIRLVDAITLPEFTVHCSSLKYRKRSRLVWLGCDSVPPPLAQLAANLKQAAEQVGLEQEERPFLPHITLKKHLRQRPETLPENIHFTFHCQHFGLYISEQFKTPHGSGVRYRSLRQWPLSATPNIRIQNEI
ncbi:RNA 2',3'-cyclic phosphodiesterase [Photobacterium sp. SDRW27]|uniref:RNA 2',3'-cyclic phosphodiesterase n=1 Tax=Photobacterium obscurum TaxID=2829490 RepID=UPI00224372A0|nr:RNA 2',3'-cyclic phosphodiesterase [Photobacterium obscurum]MCW8330532.1 RNA 2',3'-cyclic phosphodiesterase [Photobacterium obscurum]